MICNYRGANRTEQSSLVRSEYQPDEPAVVRGQRLTVTQSLIGLNIKLQSNCSYESGIQQLPTHI